jgi:hypothetical protein
MASISLHIRKVEKLRGGDYKLRVEVIPYHPINEPSRERQILDVVLPASTEKIERLDEPAFVSEEFVPWLPAGSKLDSDYIREFLKQVLRL